MQKEHVDQIQILTESIGKLIVDIQPDLTAEWEALEKLTAAHKQLRSIDISTLSQKKML